MNKRVFVSLFTAISLCIGTHSYAVKVLAISGANGLGSESDYVAG